VNLPFVISDTPVDYQSIKYTVSAFKFVVPCVYLYISDTNK